VGVTPWEQQRRELLEHQKVQIEKDLAEIRAIPQWLLDQDQETAKGIGHLILVLERRIPLLESALADITRRRNVS